jgi:hypothetical protein
MWINDILYVIGAIAAIIGFVSFAINCMEVIDFWKGSTALLRNKRVILEGFAQFFDQLAIQELIAGPNFFQRNALLNYQGMLNIAENSIDEMGTWKMAKYIFDAEVRLVQVDEQISRLSSFRDAWVACFSVSVLPNEGSDQPSDTFEA